MEEEGVVLAGAFDLAAGRALVGIGAQEIEGEAAQAGEVFRGVVLAGARAVLVHDHVEHPVELVFDLPVGAHDLGDAGGGKRLGEQVVARGGGALAVDLARGGDLGDRGETGEVVGRSASQATS